MAQINRKLYSIEILRRFLNEEELAKFDKAYQQVKKSVGGKNRYSILQAPITAEEKALIELYIHPESPNIHEYAEKNGMNATTIYGRVLRAAIRLVAQHPELLDNIKENEER